MFKISLSFITFTLNILGYQEENIKIFQKLGNIF